VNFEVRANENASLGVAAADSLRQAIATRICRQFFPRPAADINRTLRESGYDTTTALHPADISVLAKYLSSDIVVYGDVRSENRQLLVTTRLMDPTDSRIQEPLATVSNARIKFAMDKALGDEIRPALRMLPEFKRCRNSWNQGDFRTAVAAADSALGLFPQSNMARVCKIMAFDGLKMPPDSTLLLVREVLASNPRDYFAIRFGEKAEREKGNVERANEMLIQLLAINPLDAVIQEELIRVFAGAGDWVKAQEFIEAAKAANPGHPEITNLEATVCVATGQWDCAIRAYNLLRNVADTSVLNVQYFERLATAHRSLRQFREAANVAAQGATKFADSVKMHLMHSQLLREATDTVGSIRAARKALALDSTNVDIYMQVAEAFDKYVYPDSIIFTVAAGLRHVKSADDSTNLIITALSKGQTIANESQGDTLTGVPKFKTAIKYAEFVAGVKPDNNDAKFLIGVSSYNIVAAFGRAVGAGVVHTCEQFKEAKMYLDMIEPAMMGGGGAVARDIAGNILRAIADYPPYFNEQIAEKCKAGT
jgi:tetratricopeptide (TPR) repeat protein